MAGRLQPSPASGSSIGGGVDSADTAYAVKDFGGPAGVAGRVFVRSLVGLAPGQLLNGNLAVLQVLDVQRNLFQGQLSLARLRRDELASVVELYRALGGGWQ